MLQFWCSWFKYRFIKIDLVTVRKFCLINFSCALGGIVDCVNVNPAHARLNYGLRDVQNACALTKVGTVLKKVIGNNIENSHLKQYHSAQCHYWSHFGLFPCSNHSLLYHSIPSTHKNITVHTSMERSITPLQANGEVLQHDVYSKLLTANGKQQTRKGKSYLWNLFSSHQSLTRPHRNGYKHLLLFSL